MEKDKETNPTENLKKSFNYLERFKFDPRKSYTQSEIVLAAKYLKDIELMAKANHKSLESKMKTIIKGNLPNKDN